MHRPHRIPEHALDPTPPIRLVGDSPAMRRVRRAIADYGATEAPVLVTGETGTGKELVARGLHRASPRAFRPLVAVNCASLTPSLCESELFGSTRGAFTGADRDRAGVVGEARGGTLFLDEIGELPLDLQPKLLRVLENQELKRVGGNKPDEVSEWLLFASRPGGRRRARAAPAGSTPGMS